jgi:hypothetical protein
MAQAYNPNYLGGRDWEDWGLGAAQAKAHKTLISNNDWAWYHIPVIQTIPGSTNMRIAVEAGPDIKQDAISKITNTKRAGRVAQVVKCLPSKHKAPSWVFTRRERSINSFITREGKFKCKS